MFEDQPGFREERKKKCLKSEDVRLRAVKSTFSMGYV